MKLGKRIGQGYTAEVFEWGSDKIIKVFRPHTGDLMEYEWRISRQVAGLGLPVPAVYGIEEAEGKRGIVYERVAGPTLTQVIAAKPWRITQAAGQLAALHAEMHRREAPGLPKQKEVLERRIRETSLLSEETKARVIERLNRLPGEVRLCHGDLHPENMMMTAQGPVIIDWMTAMSGHPDGDAARTRLVLDYASLPPGMPKPVKLLFTALRRQLCRTYLKEYIRLTGSTMESIEAWLLPLAAARLVESITEEERGKLLKLVNRQLNG